MLAMEKDAVIMEFVTALMGGEEWIVMKSALISAWFVL
jgi:hypothetical protein